MVLIEAPLKDYRFDGVSARFCKELSTNVIIFVEKDMGSEGQRGCA